MAKDQVTLEKKPSTAAPFRVDVKLNDILMDAKVEERSKLQPGGPTLTLPEPVYPQRAYSDESDATLTEYQRFNARRTWNAWGKPYFASRSLKNRKRCTYWGILPHVVNLHIRHGGESAPFFYNGAQKVVQNVRRLFIR